MHQDEPSLLSHLNDVRESALPEGGLSTVIFCGKVQSESDMPAVLQVHHNIVEEEVNKEMVKITGVLLGQGNCVLHLLEGPSISILRMLNNLAGHRHFLDSSIQSGNIVYCVEDRPKRFFPEWYSGTIQEKKSPVEDIREENCTLVAFELATRLLDIGDILQSENLEELDFARHADQLPGRNLILALANSNLYFSLEDYVQFYFDSYHVELESEQSWPLERLVNY